MTSLRLPGRITQFFLNNKPLTILVLLATILSGVLSYTLTPKQYNPTITLPAFSVELSYPGATAEEVERLVLGEMQEKIAEIEGVDTIQAQALDGGVGRLQVQFDIGEDPEEASVKISQKIQENLDQLAFQMQPPIIKSMDPESVPIVTFGFSSPVLTQNEIRPLVFELLNELRSVDDVAHLDVHGGERRALRILLDPHAMNVRGVSPASVLAVLSASNTRRVVGDIHDGLSRSSVEVRGTLTDLETIGQLSVGEGIVLADVAEIQDAYSEKTSFVSVQHAGTGISEEKVFLSIAKRKGSNALKVVNNIHQKMETLLETDRFQDLRMYEYRNEGAVAHKALHTLFQNLLLSIGIVSLVLVIFLGVRSAFVVAIAIPLTIGLVFTVGYLFGESINRITLFALILSLGLLVDNATVIVENIFRHIQNKNSRKTAIIEAVDEVGLGLFISTLTSVIVFLPTSQISGMMGEYMGPLSFFVPMALLLSLVVAFVLTPFLADIFIRPTNTKPQKKTVFEHLSEIYARFLSGILKSHKQKKILLAVIGILFVGVASFPVLKLVHFRMLPTADKEQFFVVIDTPEGTDIEGSRTVADQVTQLVLSHPDVVSVQSFVGTPPIVDFNGFFKGSHMRSAPYMATLRGRLTAPENRSQSSSHIVASLRKSFQTYIHSTDDLLVQSSSVRFLEDPPGPPVRSMLELKVQGPDRKILRTVAQDMAERVRQKKQVFDVDTSREHPTQRIILEVDHSRALESGVSATDIQNVLSLALSPQAVGQYHIDDAQELAHIEVQFETLYRDEVQDLSSVYVGNRSGQSIPLESLIVRRSVNAPEALLTDENEPVEYVSAEMGNRSVVYPVIELMRDIHAYDFPHDGILESWDLFGFTFRLPNGEIYRLRWGGEFEMTLENFRDLGLAMLIAFILIYSVLVAQFRSFRIPLLILTTMPLGFIGIMPGFALLDAGWGVFLTATSLIGFIALMGIVVNNAIIYLEYFQVLKKKKMTTHDALVQAGKTRLRPILLTSLTTILGNLTIASDPVWSGLSWAIVFGLSVSSVLTLIVFPVLYTQTERFSNI